MIHEIGLEPIVLRRQVDAGATVIEKIEANSDVGYAFILLTPDEYAYTQDQQALEESQRHIELRARPNVIFEFGYFVGKLGRNRGCCLHKGEVVVPSDLSGLVYKKVDSSIENQAYAIVKELKAAGYKLLDYCIGKEHDEDEKKKLQKLRSELIAKEVQETLNQ